MIRYKLLIVIVAALVIAIVSLGGESRAAKILTDDEMSQLTGGYSCSCGAIACSCTEGTNCGGSGRRTCASCGGDCIGGGVCDWCVCNSPQCGREVAYCIPNECGGTCPYDGDCLFCPVGAEDCLGLGYNCPTCCSADTSGNCSYCDVGGVIECGGGSGGKVECMSSSEFGCNMGSSCDSAACGTICKSGATKACSPPSSGIKPCKCGGSSSQCPVNVCEPICNDAEASQARCGGTPDADCLCDISKCKTSVQGPNIYCESPVGSCDNGAYCYGWCPRGSSTDCDNICANVCLGGSGACGCAVPNDWDCSCT